MNNEDIRKWCHQCAVSFGVITQGKWERFVWQVNAGRKAPKG